MIMTNIITFDYPLNEKTRSYLRFEHLFLQIHASKDFNHDNEFTVFFKALFELLELSERCDIRHDLLIDLRQLSEQMKLWLISDDVDAQAVSSLLEEVELLTNALVAMPKQLRFFKNNRFLTSVKQRYSIPGGSCSFDLPQYHFWLSEEREKQRSDADIWFTHFDALEKALQLFLKIKRSQGVSSGKNAQNGFYQGEIQKSSFIRIELEKSLAVYPMLSGHKNKYSIRFMCSDVENKLAENIKFTEVCC